MIHDRETLARTERHGHALDAVEAGVAAAHPQAVIERTVRLDGTRLRIADETFDLDAYDELVVLGGGNAAGHVAAALETVLDGHIDRGLVVTDDPVETGVVEVVEGTHPLPTEANVEGTRTLLELAESVSGDDLVLVVITGGGSALLCAPIEELSVEQYRDVTDQLLRSGATIDEINAVRKHVSQLKGGQLARTLAPARTASLIFSDVVGNRLDVIASGPIAPDTSTFADAVAVRDRFDLSLPEAVDRRFERGLDGEISETPGEGDDVFAGVSNHVLADGRTALDAAAATCEDRGYEPVVLSSQIEGEAREVAKVHVGIGRECLDAGDPFEPPVALLSGGETTVTVRGDGTGGPNQEFALSAAIALSGDEGPLVASVDTDGVDGATDAAGALVDAEAAPGNERERARNALRDNDAYTFLKEQGRLVETGPTGTNVNDLRVLLVGEPSTT